VARLDVGAPDAGEIVWVDFGPPFGHEQAGRRPALVVSPRSYNERSSLIVVCPITRSPAPWPFKVELPEIDRLKGAILVDHIKSVDRQIRFVRRAGQVPGEVLNRVYAMIIAMLAIPVSD
jgi:mRNA interferase MazF